ncbi:hypothetical protein [Actinokineospora bangkokensis]|uniref:Lipoprotein n=1 Tax=Actinokineospora bangkokensis TaxID=1193682 RepID=A0A1Q9LCI8_9PSEU|nr:hypothetical protein [Actinokineospora bangkokensis]OLR89729.1 hypothetical protein BJP25_01470 [Actinokineospora bangkokensis]
MLRADVLRAAALVTAVGALTAACTGAPGDGEKVAWAGRLCAAVGTADAVLATRPPTADPADPAALRAALTAYLGTVTAGLDQVVDAAGQLRGSPVPGGDAVLDSVERGYRGLRDPLRATMTTLSGDPSPAATLSALADVVPRITAGTAAGGPAAAPGPEFTRWSQQAPECAHVPALRG